MPNYTNYLHKLLDFDTIQDGPFRGCSRIGGQLSHKSYIYETWHSYTLPKEDPKNT